MSRVFSRMGSPMSLGRLVVGLALVAGLTSCAAEGPKVKPMSCIAGESRDHGNRVPNLAYQVPCTKAHAYEVFDVIDLPSSAFSDTGPDNRDDLAIPSELGDDSPERQVFEDFAARRCTSSLQRVTGYDALRVNGKSAAAVRLLPAMRGIQAPRYSVLPEVHWSAGHHQALCSARFTPPSPSMFGRGLLQPRRSPVDRPLLTLVGTDAFPASLRPCRAYDKERKNVQSVACSKKHVSETLFYFEAEKAMGRRFVAKIVADPTAARFDQLDRVCTKVLPQLLGPGYDRKKHRGFARVPQRWSESGKPVECAVGPIDFQTDDLPAGSLIDISPARAGAGSKRGTPEPKPTEATPDAGFQYRKQPDWLQR